MDHLRIKLSEEQVAEVDRFAKLHHNTGMVLAQPFGSEHKSFGGEMILFHVPQDVAISVIKIVRPDQYMKILRDNGGVLPEELGREKV